MAHPKKQDWEGKRCQPPKLENLGYPAVQITQIWWLAPFFPDGFIPE